MTDPFTTLVENFAMLLLRGGFKEDETLKWAKLLAIYERIAVSARRSNCPKKALGGMLLCKHENPISEASNLCSPSGRGHGHIFACPRETRDRTLGKAWGLCNPVHCEILLLLNARTDPRLQDPLGWWYDPEVLYRVTADKLEHKEARTFLKSLFTNEDFEDIRGGTLFFAGVDFSCETCQAVVFEDFGIGAIVILPPFTDLVRGDMTGMKLIRRDTYLASHARPS